MKNEGYLQFFKHKLQDFSTPHVKVGISTSQYSYLTQHFRKRNVLSIVQFFLYYTFKLFFFVFSFLARDISYSSVCSIKKPPNDSSTLSCSETLKWTRLEQNTLDLWTKCIGSWENLLKSIRGKTVVCEKTIRQKKKLKRKVRVLHCVIHVFSSFLVCLYIYSVCTSLF